MKRRTRTPPSAEHFAGNVGLDSSATKSRLPVIKFRDDTPPIFGHGCHHRARWVPAAPWPADGASGLAGRAVPCGNGCKRQRNDRALRRRERALTKEGPSRIAVDTFAAFSILDPRSPYACRHINFRFRAGGNGERPHHELTGCSCAYLRSLDKGPQQVDSQGAAAQSELNATGLRDTIDLGHEAWHGLAENV